MRVLLTGGGTAGHVTPAIAIAEIIKDTYKDSEIAFAGRLGGEENRPIVNEGYKLYTVDVASPKRSLTFKNLDVLRKLITSCKEAEIIIDSFAPDLIIATGGYVSYPVLKAGIKKRIPVLLHESNAYPGLVTRLFSRKAHTVMLGIDEARDYLKRAKNVVTVGNPTRKGFGTVSRNKARGDLGIESGEIFVVSFGGSGGSKIMNETIVALMKNKDWRGKRIKHIHASGRRYFGSIKEAAPELTSGKGKCKIVPYLDNMQVLLSAADVAITRSGAMTIAELSVTGTPAILIPSPNVAANHQFKNALALTQSGAAIMISEEMLSADLLYEKLTLLARDGIMRENMKRKLKALSGGDCKRNILAVIKEVTESTKTNSAQE